MTGREGPSACHKSGTEPADCRWRSGLRWAAGISAADYHLTHSAAHTGLSAGTPGAGRADQGSAPPTARHRPQTFRPGIQSCITTSPTATSYLLTRGTAIVRQPGEQQFSLRLSSCSMPTGDALSPAGDACAYQFATGEMPGWSPHGGGGLRHGVMYTCATTTTSPSTIAATVLIARRERA